MELNVGVAARTFWIIPKSRTVKFIFLIGVSYTDSFKFLKGTSDPSIHVHPQFSVSTDELHPVPLILRPLVSVDVIRFLSNLIFKS
jgi:hypothetical protein